MSKLMHAGRSLLELLLILAVGFIPMVTGIVVMVYQLERKLDENARVSVNEALFAIDRTLDNLHAAAADALPYAGKPCEISLGSLQSRTDSDPRIRSLKLLQADQVYCSTMPIPHEYATVFKPNTNVKLSFDSPTTPNEVIVEYKLANGHQWAALASAYGVELRNELHGFQDNLVLLIEFGDAYLWSQGDSRDTERPSQSEFFYSAPSSRYSYVVKVGYADGHTMAEARQSALMVLPSLALVGLVTAAITYWGIFRERRRRPSPSSQA